MVSQRCPAGFLGCFMDGFCLFWPFDFNFDGFGFWNWGHLGILVGLSSICSDCFRIPGLVGRRACWSSLLVTCSSLPGI